MILIADGGSTKIHWSLVTASGQTTDVRTDGINPLFQTSDAMRNSVSNQLLPQIAPLLWAGTLTHIFFYGAGCTPEKKVFVQKALSMVFKKAEITVESDMLGAARGLLGHNAGVACILGTGSGSCFYNGENIEWCVPSLGYILGDEGSAAVLGKKLVGDLLKNQLGDDLKQLFFSEYNTSMADIIEHVYRQPFPNRYLAGLSKFCADHLDDERIYNLVYDHFIHFIRRNLHQYFQNGQMPNDKMVNDKMVNSVGFTGSIAYYYRPVLEKAMNAEGLCISRIMQDPIEGLKEYHKDAIVPTTV